MGKRGGSKPGTRRSTQLARKTQQILTEHDWEIVEMMSRGMTARQIWNAMGIGRKHSYPHYQAICKGTRRKYVREEVERIAEEFGKRFRQRVQMAHVRALEILQDIIDKTTVTDPSVADALAACHQIATNYGIVDGEQQAERGITAGEAILLIHNQHQERLEQGGNGNGRRNVRPPDVPEASVLPGPDAYSRK